MWFGCILLSLWLSNALAGCQGRPPGHGAERSSEWAGDVIEGTELVTRVIDGHRVASVDVSAALQAVREQEHAILNQQADLLVLDADAFLRLELQYQEVRAIHSALTLVVHLHDGRDRDLVQVMRKHLQLAADLRNTRLQRTSSGLQGGSRGARL